MIFCEFTVGFKCFRDENLIEMLNRAGNPCVMVAYVALTLILEWFSYFLLWTPLWWNLGFASSTLKCYVFAALIPILCSVLNTCVSVTAWVVCADQPTIKIPRSVMSNATFMETHFSINKLLVRVTVTNNASLYAIIWLVPSIKWMFILGMRFTVNTTLLSTATYSRWRCISTCSFRSNDQADKRNAPWYSSPMHMYADVKALFSLSIIIPGDC